MRTGPHKCPHTGSPHGCVLQDVIFLLDASSSMGGGWLDTCKDCMRRLFGECLSANDAVGLLVFQNSIVVDVPLAPWDERLRQTLENQLGEGHNSQLCVGCLD
jgi:uncharacterized protein with von Willebrand factor type A (vWA) domain